MKKLLIIIFCVSCLPLCSWGQYFVDLNKKNTFHYGNSYLIDIPLPEGMEGHNLFIQDEKNLIPLSAYSNVNKNEFLDRYDTVFISHNAPAGSMGLTRTVLQNELVQYVLGRWNIENPLDTLIDADDRFTNYHQLSLNKQFLQRKDSVLIYYAEFVGSSCCPRDTRYDGKVGILGFIKKFEHEHYVTIGRTYSLTIGDEGEGGIYLTLSGLSAKQKIEFIDQRRASLSFDYSKAPGQARIFMPHLESIAFLTDSARKADALKLSQKDDENDAMIYTAVDVEPSYPGGLSAFEALFKNIKFDIVPNIKPAIEFVVQKDGSLANVKIIRGDTPEAYQDVCDVIKKCLKWSPGKKNGKKKNVMYIVLIH